jgi:hypothetical protein
VTAVLVAFLRGTSWTLWVLADALDERARWLTFAADPDAYAGPWIDTSRRGEL